jgi:anti-anti-sigma regulatory factor
MDELNITLDEAAGDTGGVVVNVGGALMIQNVGQLKTLLLQLLAGREAICLNLCDLSKIDLAGLQLLCAVHRSSINKNIRLSFTCGDVVRAASEEAGFQRHIGCNQDKEKTCFWVGGD